MEVLIFLVGLVLGFLIGWAILNTKVRGAIRIDCSEEDEMHLFLELKENPHYLMSKPFVTLKVYKQNFLTRD